MAEVEKIQVAIKEKLQVSSSLYTLGVKVSPAQTLPTNQTVSFYIDIDATFTYALSGGFQMFPATNNVVYSCYPNSTLAPSRFYFTARNFGTGSATVYGYLIQLDDITGIFNVTVNTGSVSGSSFEYLGVTAPSGSVLCGGGFNITTSSGNPQSAVVSSYPGPDMTEWICSMTTFGSSPPSSTLTVYAVGISIPGGGYTITSTISSSGTNDFQENPVNIFNYGSEIWCGGTKVYTANYNEHFLSSSFPNGTNWISESHQEETSAEATLTTYCMTLSVS